MTALCKIAAPLIVVSMLCLSACSEAPDGKDEILANLYERRTLGFEPCERASTTQAASLVSESRCMIFERPENPDIADGRQIPLQVMVIPSLQSNPVLDPLVILAGGPGQAATELANLGLIFNKIRQARDILLLDQRGTGKLSPMRCAEDPEKLTDLSTRNLLKLQTETLDTCLSKMEADPRFYTTDIAIQDLEALRMYLGYKQLNLWGGSYGTRVALAFLKAYPKSVRTIILDGVAPTAITLPLHIERDASRALERVFEACDAEPSCSNHYPNLRMHFDDLSARFEKPQIISVTDPVTGQKLTFSADIDWLHAALRSPLYGRMTQRLMPFIIEQAYAGHYAPLLSVSALDGGINSAMFLSVICSEDVARISQANFDQAQAQPYILKSRQLNIPIIEACKIWPSRALPASYFEPVVSDKPVLVFSGASDPVTPPSWGDSILPGLVNAQHFVVEGFAHNTLGTRCTVGMITDFVDTANFAALDSSCLSNIKRRPFFIGTGGSQRHD
ncbi:alpha/beta hydrolase [Pseudomonadales bacterium]|nr:alpha/beta hydrolase [Pseudomonadales bacterium]|tara:strand:+ start:140 stop:1654 length:1515 start_codon:yes stop_codon:yes gene_type:complete